MRREREERTSKKKRADTKVPKELALTTVAEEESSSEERGGFEAYSEQPVLSPTIDQATPVLARDGDRGKQRAKPEANSNYKLLTLLKKMKEEMRERDE